MFSTKHASSGATVSGDLIQSTLVAMGPGPYQRVARKIFSRHGLSDVNQGEWYPLSLYVQALDEVRNSIMSGSLYHVGRKLWFRSPPEFKIFTFEEVVHSVPLVFNAHHRGLAADAISCVIDSPHQATVTATTPYSCDFNRGLLHSFVTRVFSSRNVVEMVEGTQCTAHGGQTCTYFVSIAGS